MISLYNLTKNINLLSFVIKFEIRKVIQYDNP